MCFLNTSAYICTCVLLLEHQTSVLIKHTVACSRWTRTHTQGQKRTMRSHQSSHTQQQPWESWKRIALSLSLSFLTQCLIYLIYLTTCLCPITPSSFPLNSLLAAMHMCVSLCVCLVETALLDKGPQGSFVKIVKHCVGLVAGDRAGVREKQGNAFRYN